MKRILGIGNALVDIMTLINDDKILEKFALSKRKHAAGRTRKNRKL